MVHAPDPHLMLLLAVACLYECADGACGLLPTGRRLPLSRTLRLAGMFFHLHLPGHRTAITAVL